MAVRHLKRYASWVQTVQDEMKRFKEAKKEKLKTIFPYLNLSFFQLHFE